MISWLRHPYEYAEPSGYGYCGPMIGWLAATMKPAGGLYT